MALCNVHVTVSGIRHDVCRVSQSFGRISSHTRFPERHQNLAFRVELDDNASLLVFSRRCLQLLGARSARVGYPHISISIDMDAMRPHEHPAAKAPDLLPGLIEVVDRVGFGAETAWSRPGRASVGGPHGFAVTVDGHAIRAAPRSSFRV